MDYSPKEPMLFYTYDSTMEAIEYNRNKGILIGLLIGIGLTAIGFYI